MYIAITRCWYSKNKMGDSKRRVRVAVIGAGASGLTSIKACLEEDIEPVCYEQCGDIGGLWTFTEKAHSYQGAAVYNSLITNTSKEMTCFSDFPFSEHYPIYPTHKMVKQYLCEYARAFDLLQYINFNTEVKKVDQAQDHESTGRWEVTVRNDQGEDIINTFDGVIIASGYFTKAWYPDIPGIGEFAGKIMHSKEFRRPDEFRDKVVLVVGNSNSAGDIAVDVGSVAKKAYLSIGKGAWIMKKILRGKPSDFVIRRCLSSVPKWLSKIISIKIAQSELDHTAFGLQPQGLGDGPLSKTAAVMLVDTMPINIASGMVTIKPHLVKLEKNSAQFDDGTSIDGLDAVIFGTGYTYSYPYCKTVSDAFKEFELFKLVFPTSLLHHTLAVIGSVRAAGPIFPVAELQARWAARVMTGKCSLPSAEVMRKDIKNRQQNFVLMDRNVPKLKKINNIELRDDIADQMGITPRFWKQIWTDPIMAFKCFFGPCFPYQYRLYGPHPWNGARDAILSAYENTYIGLKTGINKSSAKRTKYRMGTLFILVLFSALLLTWFFN